MISGFDRRDIQRWSQPSPIMVERTIHDIIKQKVLATPPQTRSISASWAARIWTGLCILVWRVWLVVLLPELQIALMLCVSRFFRVESLRDEGA